MNQDDFFDRAKDLANLIEKEGLASQAYDIRNAIDCSFTGGELFGALLWHLEQVEKSSSLSEPLRKPVSEMSREVSRILYGYGPETFQSK